MRCQAVDDNDVECTNEARYIDEYGQHMCGVCPLKFGVDSLKPEQIGELITWAREVLDGGIMGGSSFEQLRRIMGTKPEPLWTVSEETLQPFRDALASEPTLTNDEEIEEW